MHTHLTRVRMAVAGVIAAVLVMVGAVIVVNGGPTATIRGLLGKSDAVGKADAVADAVAEFPNSQNTGVPDGTTLTTYSGPCTITADGSVIDSQRVNCPSGFTIQAADVTIQKSLINGYVRLDPDSPAYDGTWTVTVTDSEIDAGTVQLAAICCGNMTVTRADLHGGITAAQCEELSDYCLIRDSWLHGQYLPDDQPWHLGGFLSDGTAGPACTGRWCIELIHNSVACDHPINRVKNGCTGDINLIPNFAPIRKVRLYNNLLRAHTDLAYCTFGGDKVGSPYTGATDLVYQDNVFERGTTNICGAYGAVTSFNVNNAGNAWTNNKYDDGTIVPSA